MPADLKIDFGEWLPDLPDLENQGLTEASNVVYHDNSYRPFFPLDANATAGTISATLTLGSTNGPTNTVVVDGGASAITGAYLGGIYKANLANAAGTWNSIGTVGGYTGSEWDFAEYEGTFIATNGVERVQGGTYNGVAQLATAGSAESTPAGFVVGTIGQFVVLGNTSGFSGSISGNNAVNWSSVDNPLDWPIAGSATANQRQAGAEFLRVEWGDVTHIDGTDEFGLVWQQRGVTRLTYIGGDEVFQFDEVEDARGTYWKNSVVRYGDNWFYASPTGFYQTNGVAAAPIGHGKVDETFLKSFQQGSNFARIWASVDPRRDVIIWAYSTGTTNAYADRMIFYDTQSGRFTEATQTLNTLARTIERPGDTGIARWQADQLSPWAFDSTKIFRRFEGTAGTATLETSEFEGNPGGRAHVSGIKSLVQWPTGITINKTIALGTRDDQDFDSITYTSEITANSRSGFSDFRSDARYHRARVKITGNFESAQGILVKASPSGDN